MINRTLLAAALGLGVLAVASAPADARHKQRHVRAHHESPRFALVHSDRFYQQGRMGFSGFGEPAWSSSGMTGYEARTWRWDRVQNARGGLWTY